MYSLASPLPSSVGALGGGNIPPVHRSPGHQHVAPGAPGWGFPPPEILIYAKYASPFFVFTLMSNFMVRSLFCNQIAVFPPPSFHPYSILLEILKKLNSNCGKCTTPPIATSWSSLRFLSHITPFNVSRLLAIILVTDASVIASSLLASSTFVNPYKNSVVSLLEGFNLAYFSLSIFQPNLIVRYL